MGRRLGIWALYHRQGRVADSRAPRWWSGRLNGSKILVMTSFEKIPGWLKGAIGAGLLLIGPVMVISFWFGGTTGGIIAIVTMLVYFMTLYIVGIRRYVERS